MKPFKVFGNMTDKNGVGATVVSHDSEKRTLVDGFSDPGCYSRDVTYHDTSFLQLAGLTASSDQCEQFIMYECDQSVLLLFGRKSYGWWVSRDGETMKYWGGADSVDDKCACGLNYTCADIKYDCNCNKGGQIWRNDSGLIKDKSKHPVKQLRFGDTDSNADDKGYHTHGKLKCFGLI